MDTVITSVHQTHQIYENDNKLLNEQIYSQVLILDEISDTNDLKDGVEPNKASNEYIKKIDKAIDDITEELEKSKKILSDLLSKKSSALSVTTDIIKAVIFQVNDYIMNITEQTIEKQLSANVDVKTLIILEKQLTDVIDRLKENYLFVETDEEHRERVKKLDNHGKKVLSIIKKDV